MRDQYGLSMVYAGDLTTLCVLSGSFVRPMDGWIADKLGGIRVLTALYLLITALLIAITPLPWLATTQSEEAAQEVPAEA